MATRRTPGRAAGRGVLEAAALRDAVTAVATRRAARGGLERRRRDDLVAAAVVRATSVIDRNPGANTSAVAFSSVMAAADELWRVPVWRTVGAAGATAPRGAAHRARLEEVLLAAVTGEGETAAPRVLNLDEMLRANGLLRLGVAVQPVPSDRTLVFDAFGPGARSLAALERTHGGGSKVPMSSRLDRHVEEIAFLGRHYGALDPRILAHLCAQVENDEARVPLAQIVQAAANYALMRSIHSPEHAEVARDVATHLGWLGRRLPGGRRSKDRICRALVRGAAQYVLLREDARDDLLHERGLWDDRRVVRATRLAVRASGNA